VPRVITRTRASCIRAAKESVDTALKYAFVGRRRKKRDFARCGSSASTPAAREHGLTYAQLMAGLKAAGMTLDRKMLADIAVNEPASFGSYRGPGQGGQAARHAAAGARREGRAAREDRQGPRSPRLV
jgi:large subunit ribosomal protein L20